MRDKNSDENRIDCCLDDILVYYEETKINKYYFCSRAMNGNVINELATSSV